MLHFKETLVDQRLSFPSMDVLSYQSVSDQFKKLSGGQWYVVPSLSLEEVSERVNSDVVVDQRPLILFFCVVLSAGIRLQRHARFGLVIIIVFESQLSELYGW